MLKNEEILHILFAILILVFVVNFSNVINDMFSQYFLLTSILFISLIVLVNLVAKKLTASHYEANLETKIWSWQRFGVRRRQKLKSSAPAGIILPFLISILSFGNFLFFAVLESEVEGTSARASKRHGRYRFTEMTDNHISVILSMGVIFNLILAVIAYLINLSELGKWSIYYATYSLIPFGNLDGTKIFFGNRVLWFALTIITLIFLSYALFLP